MAKKQQLPKAKKNRVINVGKKTPIILNDEEMFLVFNMYALEQLEDMGIDIMNLDTENVKIKDLVSIIYCGLLCYDEDIERIDVAKMIDLDNINYVSEKLTEALNKDTKGDMEVEEGKN